MGGRQTSYLFYCLSYYDVLFVDYIFWIGLTIKLIVTITAALSVAVMAIAVWFALHKPPNLSGIYVGQNSSNQMFLMKINENPQGQLTGIFEKATVYPNGAVGIHVNTLIGAKTDYGFDLTVALSPIQSAKFSGRYNNGTIKIYQGKAIYIPRRLSWSFPFIRLDHWQQSAVYLKRGGFIAFLSDIAALQAKSDGIFHAGIGQAKLEQEIVARQMVTLQQDATEQSVEPAIASDMAVISQLPAIVSRRVAELNVLAGQINSDTESMRKWSEHSASSGTSKKPRLFNVSYMLFLNENDSNNAFSTLNRFIHVQRLGIPAFEQRAQTYDLICQRRDAGLTRGDMSKSLAPKLTYCQRIAAATPMLISQTEQVSAAYDKFFAVWIEDGSIQREIIARDILPEVLNAKSFSPDFQIAVGETGLMPGN